jgi:hypothetical protein
VIVLAVIVAVAAAVRSTWSPCGLSMLSSITPFGERSRGYRYGFTAAWFVAGAVVGGAVLGGLAAGLAAGAGALDLGRYPGVAAVIAGVAALTAAGVDAGAFGDVIPLVRRQVDDRWLVRYRRWVYAAGFGWQIGVGVATYIMTAAVFLLVALAGLTASPLLAVSVCALFGLVRGSTVLLTSRAADASRLRSLHRRLDSSGPAVRLAVIAVEVAVAFGAAARLGGWAIAGVAASVAVVAGVGRRRRAAHTM